MKYLFYEAFAAMISLLTFCSPQNSITLHGGGSEITGRVVTTSGLPASSTTVTIINACGTDSFTQVTNDNGEYRFGTKVPYGLYTLSGTRTADSLSFIVPDLRYDSTDYIDRIDTLWKTGWIYSKVTLEDDSNALGIKMFIPGTSFIGMSAQYGNVALWNIPPGKFKLLYMFQGYVTDSAFALVYPGKIDTLPSIVLQRDPSVPILVPNVELVAGNYDTMTSVLELPWKKVNAPIKWYEIAIYRDTSFEAKPFGTVFTKDTVFFDTLFTADTADTARKKLKMYQVRAIDKKNNTGQWGDFYSITAFRPLTPPAPKCTASIVAGTMIIAITGEFRKLWWVDSLFIKRSFSDEAPQPIASLAMMEQLAFHDTIDTLPNRIDSVISITYSLLTKSRYDSLSKPWSPSPVIFSNPTINYSLPRPARPIGPDSMPLGSYQYTIASIASPIADDVVEYRLIISDPLSDSTRSTQWYAIPCIEALLEYSGNYLIRCQARSRRLHCLRSELSEALEVTAVHAHSVPKPTTPIGPASGLCGNTYTYYSDYSDVCSLEHPVAVRYIVSYQGESQADSTGWLTKPHTSVPMIWTKPGIAYLRAQTRCATDNAIISPWSDALVITVSK